MSLNRKRKPDIPYMFSTSESSGRKIVKPKKKKNQNEKNERKRLRLQEFLNLNSSMADFARDQQNTLIRNINEGNVCDKAPKFDIKAVKQYLEKAAEIQKRYEPTPQGVLVFGSGDCVSKIIFICFV